MTEIEQAAIAAEAQAAKALDWMRRLAEAERTIRRVLRDVSDDLRASGGQDDDLVLILRRSIPVDEALRELGESVAGYKAVQELEGERARRRQARSQQ